MIEVSTCTDAEVGDINLEMLEKARRLLDVHTRKPSFPDFPIFPRKDAEFKIHSLSLGYGPNPFHIPPSPSA